MPEARYGHHACGCTRCEQAALAAAAGRTARQGASIGAALAPLRAGALDRPVGKARGNRRLCAGQALEQRALRVGRVGDAVDRAGLLHRRPALEKRPFLAVGQDRVPRGPDFQAALLKDDVHAAGAVRATHDGDLVFQIGPELGVGAPFGSAALPPGGRVRQAHGGLAECVVDIGLRERGCHGVPPCRCCGFRVERRQVRPARHKPGGHRRGTGDTARRSASEGGVVRETRWPAGARGPDQAFTR